MSRVVAEVEAFLERHAPAGGAVVAVSGGADSVALLRAMLDAGATGVTVAHFNHRLRGAESDADEAFVRGLAATLGVPFRLGSADVTAVADAGRENLEAAARRLRYGWLADVARKTEAGWVATGHTADDQAETVLHRLIRGTGIRGLAGIARERMLEFPFDHPPPPGTRRRVQLSRPLLTVTRDEIVDYLAALGQPTRTDSSNADLGLTRNRIRHELLPLLKTFNPDVVAALGRLARQADEADLFTRAEATKLLKEVERPRAGRLVVLDVGRFELPTGVPTDLDDAVSHYLIREMFRVLWEREGWPTGGMTAEHWQRLLWIAWEIVPASEFPGGVVARRVGRVVQLGRRE